MTSRTFGGAAAPGPANRGAKKASEMARFTGSPPTAKGRGRVYFTGHGGDRIALYLAFQSPARHHSNAGDSTGPAPLARPSTARSRMLRMSWATVLALVVAPLAGAAEPSFRD